MSIVSEVFKELYAMFLGDARLACAALFLVTLVGSLVVGLKIEPLLGGGILFLGCLAILVEAAYRETKRQTHP